jgi:hypothetical protein
MLTRHTVAVIAVRLSGDEFPSVVRQSLGVAAPIQ